jgi:uncharacterized protein
MQKGIVSFDDLSEGMTVTGKIKNVVDFGAFVDIGLKETALVHISELADHYIKDPLEAVKAGDVLEFRIISLDRDRRRISLSRKKDAPAQKPAAAVRSGDSVGHDGKRTVVVKKAAAVERTAETGVPSRKRPPDDDGVMYNPFAAAFKKRED